MSKITHSESPWTYLPIGDGNCRIQSGEKRVAIVFFPHGYVGDVKRLLPSKNEALRNLDLILSAPQLLRELENLHDYLMELTAHQCSETCSVALAIKKAKGIE